MEQNGQINATKKKIENQLARFTFVRLKNQENVYNFFVVVVANKSVNI